MKYLWRHRRKGGTEDLEKAKWYIDRMIEIEAAHEEAFDLVAQAYNVPPSVIIDNGNDATAQAVETFRNLEK